jgi:dTDP-4-dehydrorhamnose reductase
MLGSAIARLCGDAGFHVGTPSSAELSIVDAVALGRHLDRERIDVVINCAVVKDFSDRSRWPEAFAVNAMGPIFLAGLAAERGIHLVQVSTDVMFAPTAGPFDESAAARPVGPYALSKRGGEVDVALVIRGSFIGPSGRSGRPSIMERLTSGESIELGRLEKWNGLTTLELARLLVRYLGKGQWIEGIRHVHGPDTTRYDFAECLRATFDLPGTVLDNGRQRDLRLATRFDDLLMGLTFPRIEERIKDLMVLRGISKRP